MGRQAWPQDVEEMRAGPGTVIVAATSSTTPCEAFAEVGAAPPLVDRFHWAILSRHTQNTGEGCADRTILDNDGV